MPGSVHAQAPDRRARPEIVDLLCGQESATPETGGTEYLAIGRAFSLTLAFTHGPLGRCHCSDVKESLQLRAFRPSRLLQSSHTGSHILRTAHPAAKNKQDRHLRQPATEASDQETELPDISGQFNH